MTARLKPRPFKTIDHADARRIDKDSVALALVDDFRVAGDQLHVGFGGGLLHRGNDGAECFHLESFFENESCAQVERARAAHREIVHRAIDGEIADIAAGENQGADNEGIRGEGQARSIYRDDRAIMPLLEHGIAEGRHEDFFDELMSEASAAAMREDDAIVSDSRDWTAQVERDGFGVCHSDSRPRTRLLTIPWERPGDFPGYTSRQKRGSREAS